MSELRKSILRIEDEPLSARGIVGILLICSAFVLYLVSVGCVYFSLNNMDVEICTLINDESCEDFEEYIDWE